MTDLLPEAVTANGNPFRQPRSFALDGVEAALFPASALVSQAVKVGDLIQARADRTAALADAAQGIEASGVCVRVLSASTIIWSHDAMAWLHLEGAAAQGLQRLFLGNEGQVVSSPPAQGMIQRVGVAIQYDSVSLKYRCRITPEPGSSVLG